jgi:hypothetical protein
MTTTNHPAFLSCTAPPPGVSWTPDEAREVAEIHEDCLATVCPAKRHARHVLAEAYDLSHGAER